MERNLLRSAILILFLFVGISGFGQTIRYVKQSAFGTADGTSWANAGNDLQAMINISSSGDQIWIAGGIYKPNRAANDINTVTLNNRDNAFVLKEGVKIYGGFAGTENAITQRDLTITANESVLSGDFNDNDNPYAYLSTSENAYHVVVIAGNNGVINNNTVLDGFTVKGGNASGSNSLAINGIAVSRGSGGGISINNSNPLISNIIITLNSAGDGGGLYNSSSSPLIIKSTLQNNKAGSGGGISNYNSTPSILNSSVSLNTAMFGGGINNYNSSALVTSTVITGNNAIGYEGSQYDSGGDGLGGGIYNDASSPVITNCLIAGNNAEGGNGIDNHGMGDSDGSAGGSGYGGGIYNYQSSPTITNTTLIYNGTFSGSGYGTGYRRGGGLYNETGSSPKVRNSIIYGNTATTGTNIYNSGSTPVFNYSLVQGSSSGWNNLGTNGGNNIDADPLFTNVSTGNYVPQGTSSVINAGSNAYYEVGATPDLSEITTDLAGDSRNFEGTVDIGAYEVQGTPCSASSPTASAQIFCGSSTVANLTATGTDL
ncbi:hypothetical protein GR160_17835, partial [Flavobacterium sp. Sd200]|uniref:choice-of-anchor Q domain-containing protein n=1 Tax=Flavobacterium sp. Sd200 TaxID=2692211 RepID=UPI00144C4332